jgi:gliding motility-associated-like protein
MKLKLLFFMGILSVLFNTMNARDGKALPLKPASLPPTISADKLVSKLIDDRVTCPAVIVANIVFYINDDQTIFPNLIVTATSDNQLLLSDGNLTVFGASLGDRFLTLTTNPGIIGFANVTVTVEDGDGQKTSTTFKVTTQDLAPPTLTGVSNKTENVDSACGFSIPDYTLLTTASDDCLVPTVTQSPLAGTVISGHNTQQIVILTATDSVGKTATTSFTVTLIDDIDPVITCNGDINQNQDIGVCSAVVSFSDPIITDNCSATWIQTAGLASGSSFPVGTTTNTFVATDEAGNTSSCSFNVIVSDIILPTVTTQPKTVYLNSAGNVTITASDIDNASLDNCAIDSKVLDITSFTCANVGTNTVILTVTDTSGNVASATAVVTVVDNEKPVITPSGNQTVSNDAGFCRATVNVSATATDNCLPMTNTPSSLRSDSLLLSDAYPVGTTTITWSVTDNNGNSASTTQTVTVNDNEKPVIIPTGGDQTVSNDAGFCRATVNVSATATDNCLPMTNTPNGVRSDALALNALYPVGTTTITWTVTDNNGNSALATQTVTVNDTENPNVVTQNKTVYLDASGNVSITTIDINNSSTDNCGTIVSLSLDKTSFTCTDLGNNTVQLTVTDTAGNSATGSATVTVVDDILPTIMTSGPIAIGTDDDLCSGTTTVVPATATDNCSIGFPTWSRSDSASSLNDPFQKGVTTITWSVTDLGGNVASATQTVTVTDDQAPVFAFAFLDLTVNNDPGFCSYATNQLPVPSVTDNCNPFSGIVTITPATIPVSAGPDHVPSIVTWTATDNYGNTVSATQNVTVQDLELPVMRTKNITLYYDANGQIIILPSDIDNGSTDNSGTLCFTKYVVDNILDCNEKGDNTVILTGTDLWGNQHYKEAIVTAIDNTPPTISAPATVALNTNSACTWVGALVSPTTADNCSVVSVTNDAPAALSLGDTTVTWTVTDASGNTASTTQLVTVTDIEKPVAKASDITIKLDASGAATITVAQVNNGSSDNCGIASTVISKPNFDCTNVGPNTVILTVTDNSNNVSTANAIVTVVDDVLPVIATVSAITANTNSGCGANITVVAPSATDNCTNGTAVGTRSDAKLLSADYPLGRTVITWNFTDASGNAALAVIQTVDVSDDDKPTITTTPIVVDTNSACIWTGTLGLPLTADNCTVASVTSDRAADFAYPVGNTIVTWTVKDLAGNTETAVQTVTVRDTEKPIAKATDITIKLSSLVGAGAATITVADIDNGSSDNCGIKSVTISKDSFDCTNVGKNTVVLTVTDTSISPIATGNVSTANAIVTVVDDVLPVIAPVTEITVNNTTGKCGADLAVTPSATATDNCTVGTPIGTRSDARALSATYPLGRTTITWNVTDANGNRALSVIQTVDVTDAQIPVIISNGILLTANADLGGCSAVVTVSATATDNCSVGTPTGVRSDAKPLASPYPVGSTTITWNVTDVNGNAAIAVTQTVTVTDTQKPVITANGNKNFVSDFGQCGAIVAVSATATDNCSVTNPVVGTRSDAALINALYPVGTTTITWNVTDVNANAATPVVQTVVVRDLQIPVINGTVVSIDANTDATTCGATVTVTPPSATDNCSVVSPIGTRSDNLALTALYPIGTTTITWRVTDVNGNTAIPTTTTVKVKDMVLPTVITQNIPVQLNVGGFVTIVPAQVNNGSTDNCGIASYSLDKVSFNCSNIGANTVTLTVIDIHGNLNTATATVTVSEPIIPIARTRNITVQLNAAGTVSILPSDINNGSTDNCSIASYTLSQSTFNCSNVGQNIITLTATDASGNNSVPVNATVTVQDVTAPVVVTQPYTAQLNVSGLATVTAANVNNGSTDACGIATYAISKSSFTCANVGSNVVTLTVTDVNGNVNQAFATVLVVDSVKPVVVAKDIELVLDGISVSITPEDVFVSATDACGVDVHSYTLSRDTFTIVDVLNSPITVTLSVTDVNGNVGTDDFTITFPVDPTNAVEAITPNGDGLNDTWVIENITNHPKSVVRVYNRWGSMVFSALNYQNNWDGRLNGSDATLPDGQAYYYQVDLKGNGTIDKEGWVYIKK